MKFIEAVLESLGLNKNEIKCYICVLGNGEMLASEISSRLGINRSTGQYTCQQLAKKGILTCLQKGNAFYYYANNPDVLKKIIDQEKFQLKKKEKNVEAILGELKTIKNPGLGLPKVRFFEGLNGIIEAFEDDLDKVRIMYSVIKVNEDIDPDFLDYIHSNFRLKIKNLDYQSYTLANENKKSLDFFATDTIKNRFRLTLPQEKFPFQACLHIYNGKVCLYSVKKTALNAVIVEDKNVYDTLFALFKASWELAKSLRS